MQTETQNPIELLKQFGRNLTEEAKKNTIDPIIGRDEEVRRLIRIISRKTKNNPILIGEPGVGKTAIVEGLAKRIALGNVPYGLKNKEIFELDASSLISGASFQGEFEKRLKSVLKAIEESNGDIIIFIDEIHILMGMGKNGQGGLDAAQMLKPLMARGKIKLIGATTLDEYKKYIEKDAAFERRLQTIMVNEPSKDDALTILRGIKERYENYHRVKILDEALIAAVKFSTRYITNRYLPDKAIDLIDEASAEVQTKLNSKPEEIENMEQKLAFLEMQKYALDKEDAKKNKGKISELNKEIESNIKILSELESKWNSTKDKMIQLSKLKKDLDDAKSKQYFLQQDGEYEQAAKYLYKVIPEIDEKIEKIQKENKELEKQDIVDSQKIASVVSKWTGIPINKLTGDEKKKVLEIDKELKSRVKGQDEAVDIVSDVIIRSKANINDPSKPLGSFIFMGPTGVGKTELAKSLAYNLFDTEEALVRIDMSEYQEQHSVSRLIGSPPGYVGYEEGGQLTETIRNKPYSIVLLDEIEKAHPKVLDVLLQILDDGHITDGLGHKVNFKNTIVILTTNVGSTLLLEGKEKEALDLMKISLRPELINRIDEIVTFKKLEMKAIEQIVKLELNKLSSRIEENNMFVEFDQDVIKQVAKDGYDPAFGARPIKRYIQKNIESYIAKKILDRSISEDVKYVLNYNNNEFKLSEIKSN